MRVFIFSRSTIATYRSVLEKLSGGKLPSESSIPALKPLVKSYDIVTPNIMARATVYSQFKNTSTIRPPFSKTIVESARGTNGEKKQIIQNYMKRSYLTNLI